MNWSPSQCQVLDEQNARDNLQRKVRHSFSIHKNIQFMMSAQQFHKASPNSLKLIQIERRVSTDTRIAFQLKCLVSQRLAIKISFMSLNIWSYY